jgi:hypothetical protein
MLAPYGHPVLRVRVRGRNFSTVHPCTDEKRRASCAPPYGFNRPRPPLRRGPFCRQRIHALSSLRFDSPSIAKQGAMSRVYMLPKAACAVKNADRAGSSRGQESPPGPDGLGRGCFSAGAEARAFGRTHPVAEVRARERMDALPETGPLRSGVQWRSTRRAMRTMRIVFRWHMDVPSKNSVAAREPFAHGCAKGAELGASFLSVTFRWTSNER